MVATAITAAIIAHGATTGTSKVYSKVREYLDTETAQTVFEETLSQKIERRAEEFDSPALGNVVHHWSAITDDINTYEGVRLTATWPLSRLRTVKNVLTIEIPKNV